MRCATHVYQLYMPAHFFYADDACQPVCITRENVQTYIVPLAPPVYEVILNTNVSSTLFRGMSTRGMHEARRRAIERLRVHLERHALVCTEMTSVVRTTPTSYGTI